MRIILPEVKVDNSYAVVFDPDTLAIHSITRKHSVTEHDTWLETTYEDVEPILSGKENLNQCNVIYDMKSKQYQLSRNTLDNPIYNVTELIYQVPESTEEPADIQVVQDVKNTCWKFLMGDALRTKLTNNRINANIEVSFSITEENNPNVLYRTLSFSLKDLLQNFYVVLDFKQEREFSGEPVSVYTIHKFDTYSYEVIK